MAEGWEGVMLEAYEEEGEKDRYLMTRISPKSAHPHRGLWNVPQGP